MNCLGEKDMTLQFRKWRIWLEKHRPDTKTVNIIMKLIKQLDLYSKRASIAFVTYKKQFQQLVSCYFN